MDLDSESVSQEMSRSTIPSRMNGTLAVDNSSLPSPCALCQRILSSDNEAGDLEGISICGDCKFLFLEDNGTSIRDTYRRTPRVRRRRRYNSSESIENLFSHMFNLARQNQPVVFENENHAVDGDATAWLVQRSSSRTTSSGSQRWRRVLSDTESDGFDSYYAESESNVSDTISFSAYGVDSDASVDGHSFVDNEIFSHPDLDTDTDIDPMHAGPNQWNSDDQEEEEEEEEHYWDEADPYVGNSGDYLHPRGFEELLEHLAGTDNSRQGAPPAAVSFVNSLKRVVINEEHEKQDGLCCAICKDSLSVGTVVHQLPCFHLYHPSCILPWLSTRNSCPLCRYELPTDDKDYENGKQSSRSGLDIHEIRQQGVNEEDSSSDITEADEAREFVHGRADTVERSGEESESGRWLFLAAPIVSLMGIGLVLWLGNPLTERRGLFAHRDFPVQGQHSNRRSENNQSRRWWSLF